MTREQITRRLGRLLPQCRVIIQDGRGERHIYTPVGNTVEAAVMAASWAAEQELIAPARIVNIGAVPKGEG